MPELETFLPALLGNIVFLICLLPLVGAMLVLISGGLGAGHARSTALTNAMLTLALSLLMAANYQSSAGESEGAGAGADIQMESAFRWVGTTTNGESAAGDRPLLGGMTIHFAVGVDGISLWPIVLTALLTVAAIVAVDGEESRQSRLLYAMLLLEQSLASCLFAALDPVLFCVCLQLTLVPMYFLLGERGGYERRPLARGFFILNLGGSLAITIGLMTVVLIVARVAPAATLIVPRLITTFADIAGSVGANDWAAVGPWILGALVAGCSVRLCLFPWHGLFAATIGQAARPPGLMLAGLLPLTGLYTLARFVVPLLDISASKWSTGLQGGAAGGAVYFGLLAWSQPDLRARVVSIGLSWIHLGAAGLFSITPTGMTGGFLAVCGLSLSVGSLCLAGSETESGAGNRRGRAGLMISLLTLLGIPGSAAFAGALLALWGLSSVNEPAAIAGLVAWLLCSCALIRAAGPLRQISDSTVGRQQSAATMSWGLRQLLLVLFLAMIVWVGLYPEFFTQRMQSSVAHLYQTAADE